MNKLWRSGLKYMKPATDKQNAFIKKLINEIEPEERKIIYFKFSISAESDLYKLNVEDAGSLIWELTKRRW